MNKDILTSEDYRKLKPISIFLRYLKRHKSLFILDLSCAFLASAIDLVYPFISRLAMYTWLPNQAYKAFFSVMAIIFLAYIIKGILYYVFGYWGHRFGTYVEADMRTDLFAHIQALEFSFFDRNRTGQLMSRITSDLFEVTELSHHGPEDLLIAAVTIAGSLILVATIEWRLALLLAVIIPVFIVVLLALKKKRMAVALEVKVTTGKINAQIESNLSGMKTARAFANERIEYGKFLSSVEDFKNSKKEYYKYMAGFNSLMEFFCCIMSVAVMTLGGFYIMRGSLNYVDLLTFCLYINTFITPIRKLVNFSETYASGVAGFSRFLEIMRLEPSIKDSENANALVVDKGEIDIKGVSFEYNRDNGILDGISLKVNGGETLAVVGPSGGGKTTLCQLIPRFYDVTEGSISIDGQNIKDVTQDSLHTSIGIVQQDVFLFADTVMENIRYGRPSATDDEVIEAAKKAEIYDDVMEMPDKFKTYVGERGTLLSGGQKQRIAIARIFLKNPPVLILDEATSALDSITEAKIQNAFDKLSEGRTTLIIAHRLSTIKKANRIIVIENGKITEQGSHSQLLEKNGTYAGLYNIQK